MNSLCRILPLSILLLTSACALPAKAVISADNSLPAAVQTSYKSYIAAHKLDIGDSIDTDDPKFIELEPFGPASGIYTHLEYMKDLNEEYKEIAVSYMIDFGTNVAPYTTCSLYKKGSTGKYNIVAVSDIGLLQPGGESSMDNWYHIIYADQERQAKGAILDSLSEHKTNNEFRVTGLAGYDHIEVLSDSELSIQAGYWMGWRDKDYYKRQIYRATMEKDNEAGWVIKSISLIK